MLNKKHFITIANILGMHHDITTGETNRRIAMIVDDLCDYFETVNPLFKKDLFIKQVLAK